MATVLHVYDSQSVREKMEAGDRVRVSSAPRYDEALLSIFPYFMYVSYDDAHTLTHIIEEGIQGRAGFEGVGSYASTMDFRTDGKVLWVSASSYITLEQWLDPAEFVLTKIPTQRLFGTSAMHQAVIE